MHAPRSAPRFPAPLLVLVLLLAAAAGVWAQEAPDRPRLEQAMAREKANVERLRREIEAVDGRMATLDDQAAAASLEQRKARLQSEMLFSLYEVEDIASQLRGRAASPRPPSPPSQGESGANQASPQDGPRLGDLLAAAQQSKSMAEMDLEQARRATEALPPRDPAWPLARFLLAEALAAQGQAESAAQEHLRLLRWSLSDPHGDGQGGSGLVLLSLWRCLESAGRTGGAEGRELAAATPRVLDLPLARGMLEQDLLSALPQLEGRILSLACARAQELGEERLAQDLFLRHLPLSGADPLTPQERRLWDGLAAQGRAPGWQLALTRGKRLAALGQREQALALLRQAADQAPGAARAQALWEACLLEDQHQRGLQREEVVRMLDRLIQEDADPQLSREAHLLRHRVLGRSGPGRQPEAALESLRELGRRHPDSPQAAEGLYLLARHHQARGERQACLDHYRQLQNFPAPHDKFNLSYFQPAIFLYSQGGAENRRAAQELLGELMRKRPDGPLRLAAMFWLGRMAEEEQRPQEAGDWFRRLLADAPYDYYAVRARMHLRQGLEARRQTWPDQGVAEELAAAFSASGLSLHLPERSVYHRRLRAALESGLYALAMGAESRLRLDFPQRRLSELTPQELGSTALPAQMGLLLALRGDALAAVGLDLSADNVLGVMGAVGNGAQDWAFALYHMVRNDRFQTSPHYLATAFPSCYKELFQEMGRVYNAPAELLYCVAREESFFFPQAQSSKGALGLFQFMPATLNNLRQKYPDLPLGDSPARPGSLLNPELSIRLGGFWFGRELLPSQKGDLARAVMEHHAGNNAVRAWAKTWEAAGRGDDIEYQVETVGSASTRIFLRRILADLALTRSAGLLRP